MYETYTQWSLVNWSPENLIFQLMLLRIIVFHVPLSHIHWISNGYYPFKYDVHSTQPKIWKIFIQQKFLYRFCFSRPQSNLDLFLFHIIQKLDSVCAQCTTSVTNKPSNKFWNKFRHST